MIGQQGRDDHRKLSATEYQRIEVGIEFASDVFRAEDELDAPDNPKHEEAFQKSDDETGGYQQFDVGLTGTEPAEKELECKVDEEQRFAGQCSQNFGYDGVGYGHACRCSIVADGDVFGVDAQRVRYFYHNVSSI